MAQIILDHVEKAYPGGVKAVDELSLNIADGDRVLLTQRPGGTHLAGAWEFPGGSRSLRRAALLHKVPYYTTLSGAVAAAQGIKAYLAGDLEVRALQSYFGGKGSLGNPG